MELFLIGGLAAIVAMASGWRLARQSAELKLSRARIAALEEQAGQHELEIAAIERTLRFQHAVSKTFAADVESYLHKCRHDLTSALNVATGFLELMAQAENPLSAGNCRRDQIRRAQIALDKACKLTIQMPLQAPELSLNSDPGQTGNGQSSPRGRPIGGPHRG